MNKPSYEDAEYSKSVYDARTEFENLICMRLKRPLTLMHVKR